MAKIFGATNAAIDEFQKHKREMCDEICDLVEKTREVVNPVKERLRGERRNAERALQEVDQDAALAAMDAFTEAIRLKIALNQLALQFFSGNNAASPMRRLLQNWHDDIDRAMAGQSLAARHTPHRRRPELRFAARSQWGRNARHADLRPRSLAAMQRSFAR